MNQYTYVSAYFAKNLGDDMFVQTLVRRYPHERFFIMQTKKRIGDLACEKNVRTLTVPIRLYLKVRKTFLRSKNDDNFILKRAKVVIRIGGSIFIENNNKEYVFDSFNANTFIIGANFGPYTSEEFLFHAIQQISKTRDCCLRDRYSYNLLSKQLSNVRYAPDILFGYSYLPKEKSGNSIGISVIDFTNRESIRCEKENYINGISSICRYYIENNYNVILFGFCESEGDGYAIDEVINSVGITSGIKKCMYSGNILNFIKEINKCEKIYATRFHAMIIGWVMKKNVVPIIYSNKQLNVINDVGFRGVKWDILHHQDIPCDFLEANNGTLPDDIIQRLRTGAYEHFRKLDEFYMGEE